MRSCTRIHLSFWLWALRKRCIFPSHWRTERRRRGNEFSSHLLRCCAHLLPSHIICLHPALLLSSICLRSKRAVSHFVMSVPKSHFLSRNTLAEVCSAITCWIIGLSPTISRETRDGGPPRTRPGNWLLARWTHKYRTFPKKPQKPHIICWMVMSRSWPLASVNDVSFVPMMQKSSEHTSEDSQYCWQIPDPPDYGIKKNTGVYWLVSAELDTITYVAVVSTSIHFVPCWEVLESDPGAELHPGPIACLSQEGNVYRLIQIWLWRNIRACTACVLWTPSGVSMLFCFHVTCIHLFSVAATSRCCNFPLPSVCFSFNIKRTSAV